jgi:hypothetical protein
MEKKRLWAVLTLIGLCAFVVAGSPPEFLGKLLFSLQDDSITNVLSTDERIAEVIRKAGHEKRQASSAPSRSISAERPDSMLWYITFDFCRKIEAKATELAAESGDGSLYDKYFVRQGHLSPENDLILKQKAAQYFDAIAPIEQRAKTIAEKARAEHLAKNPDQPLAFVPISPELKNLQGEKDQITTSYRASIKEAFGEAEFNDFLAFLNSDFSEGALAGKVPTSPEGIYYEGWTWIIWDDSPQPPRITGFSELYFYYFFPTAPYDPSLDSYFVNLTTQQFLSVGSSTGYHDWIPAQYLHPVFASIRGHQY